MVLVNCLDEAVFYGSVTAAFDPLSSYDSIQMTCEDFTNSTKLELTSEQFSHVKYDPYNQLLYWADWNLAEVRRGIAGVELCFTEAVIEGIKGK